MADLPEGEWGYSTWIQPSRSSLLTASRRAGWSVAMCSRITAITCSSSSPRATNPHSQRISLAIGVLHVWCRAILLGRCWRDLGAGELAPADPDLRTAGHRTARPTARRSPAGPAGPPAVHLPRREPPPAGPPRRTRRGAVAGPRRRDGRGGAQPAAVQAAPHARDRRHRRPLTAAAAAARGLGRPGS